MFLKMTKNTAKTKKTNTKITSNRTDKYDSVKSETEKEEKRLNKILFEIEKNKKAVVQGLIKKCAYLHALINVLEADIVENGATELFTQSENTAPYERMRPEAQLLNSYNSTYQKSVKMLLDLLPAEQKTAVVEQSDGFDEFVKMRK